MITAVNFADKKYKRNQKWCSFTAKLFGKVNSVIEYSPKDIDNDVLKKYKSATKYSKGFGNYFWKPLLVNKALSEISEGDYLFWTDSGAIFIKSLLPIVKHLENKNKSMLCFKLPLIEKQWTKRDAFILMGCDTPDYTESNQLLATFILIKKCQKTIDILNKWEKYAQDSRILTDDPSVLGDNYSEFIEHRHDQSILSLLCKNNTDVLIEGDLSDYGSFPYRYLTNPSYIYHEESLNLPRQNIFKSTILNNRTVHPLIYILKYTVRLMLYKIGVKD